MKWPDRFFVLPEVMIEFCGPLESLLEKDLMETVILYRKLLLLECKHCD